MRLTFPVEKKREATRKNLFILVEFVWHTFLPLLLLFIGLEYNYLICIFILFSFFRIRPDPEDL